MKILFRKKGSRIHLVEKEQMIFRIDDSFFDASGNEVPFEPPAVRIRDEDRKKCRGLAQPLSAESATAVEWEIDDGFGKFGFQNEAGEFVIEPQYAYAYDFTKGLAAVNLNRTWYQTEDGERHYENHYGYINERGQTVIGFQFDEAYPFNKYGVAVVSDILHGMWLIDLEGNEIPGTHFPYLSHYYDYEHRFLAFSYDTDTDCTVGIYDTKERRILLEPCVEDIEEYDEDRILVYEREGQSCVSDFRKYYINSKGEILFPWLYNKGFAIVEAPDANQVTAVAVLKHREQNERSLGLYSSKEEFLLPLAYDRIQNLGGNLWSCSKDGVITVVQTEETD